LSAFTVPKGFRLHIGIFGRRNTGKSSLLNALTRQQTSIVSDVAGTTTDPIEKPMEFLPIGPVLFIDTAGIDDEGELGNLRIEKTMQFFDRTEIGILVVDTTRFAREDGWGCYENKVLSELKRRNIPVLVVFNKTDIAGVPSDIQTKLDSEQIPYVKTAVPGYESRLRKNSALSAEEEGPESDSRNWKKDSGIPGFRDALVRLVPEEFLTPPPILSDLLPAGEFAVLVVPIDKEAPKGRLILPQVQAIRDILDGHEGCLVVQENMLDTAIRRLNPPPRLVVTDSQAFKTVASIVPREIPLTSFSILFARQKGDLITMVEGAATISQLTPKSRVLIAESCSHHPITEDIGTEKIPNWLRKAVGALEIGHVQGHDFPATVEELARWDLVIHCGACMWNRREMLSRIARCVEAGVPITNYGLAIAFLHGILGRALAVFPEAQKKYREITGDIV